MNKISFSRLYHQKTKKFEQAPFEKLKEAPKELTTVFYKNYPRLKKISLSCEKKKFDLFEAIEKRSSKRDMQGGEISQGELAMLLKYSCGLTNNADGFWRRAYPSAGARYPIETYVILLKPASDLEKGIFHYNVKKNCLERISQKNFGGEIGRMVFGDLLGEVSALVFLTGVFWRTQNKYGDRGYRFILQESGHIGQNIHLVAESLNLRCCALGGFPKISDEDVEKFLRIDGVSESLIYSLAIGK